MGSGAGGGWPPPPPPSDGGGGGGGPSPPCDDDVGWEGGGGGRRLDDGICRRRGWWRCAGVEGRAVVVLVVAVAVAVATRPAGSCRCGGLLPLAYRRASSLLAWSILLYYRARVLTEGVVNACALILPYKIIHSNPEPPRLRTNSTDPVHCRLALPH